MKKLILILLLFTGFSQAQTLQNPTYDKTTTNTLKIKAPATVTSVNFLPAFDSDGFTVSKIDPVNLPFVTLSTAQTITGAKIFTNNSGVVSTTTAKANGEQFYSQSGENFLGLSSNVIESQSGGTGTDFTPSAPFVAVKFTTSSTVSFIQGIQLKVKNSGSISAMSTLIVKLYSNASNAPNVQIGSTGMIYGGQTTASYKDFTITFQNISIPLTPSTQYWAVITRVESGGNFIINSQVGTGTTYQGATALTATADANIQISNVIYARSNYGGHFVAQNSHGVWATSISGVAVRGDGRSHYGGYFASESGDGANGNSVYGYGLVGLSTNNSGVLAQTGNTLGYPAFRADNTAGITFLAAYINGRSQLLGRTTIGAGTDYGAMFEASGTARISGNLLLKNTGVTYASQDTGERLQVDGTALISGVTTINTTSQQSLSVINNLNTMDNRFRNVCGTSMFMAQTFGELHPTNPNLTQLSSTGDLGLVTGGVIGLRLNQSSRTLIGLSPTDNGVDRLQVYGTASFTGNISGIAGTTANHLVIKSQLDLKADLASPAFTLVPTAPTAAAGTNTTQLATTAFVTAALSTVNTNVIHTTGNESRTGTLTFNQTSNPGKLVIDTDQASGETLKTYNNSGVEVFKITTGAVSSGNFRSGMAVSYIYGDTGSLGANREFTVPNATLSTSAVNKSQLDAAFTPGLKRYTALIDQSSTSAPTVTVLGTNTIGSIVWTRTGVGTYTGTLSSAFTSNKTFLTNNVTSSGIILFSSANTNTVTISTTDLTGTPIDGKLTNTSFKIEIYP